MLRDSVSVFPLALHFDGRQKVYHTFKCLKREQTDVSSFIDIKREFNPFGVFGSKSQKRRTLQRPSHCFGCQTEHTYLNADVTFACISII